MIIKHFYLQWSVPLHNVKTTNFIIILNGTLIFTIMKLNDQTLLHFSAIVNLDWVFRISCSAVFVVYLIQTFLVKLKEKLFLWHESFESVNVWRLSRHWKKYFQKKRKKTSTKLTQKIKLEFRKINIFNSNDPK
jgi:hypothetical protein